MHRRATDSVYTSSPNFSASLISRAMVAWWPPLCFAWGVDFYFAWGLQAEATMIPWDSSHLPQGHIREA
jgi:hypothetical protein